MAWDRIDHRADDQTRLVAAVAPAMVGPANDHGVTGTHDDVVNVGEQVHLSGHAGRDDLLAVFSAGAYGMVMSSNYNTRPRAAEVLVEGGNARLVRRRETYEDLVEQELMN